MNKYTKDQIKNLGLDISNPKHDKLIQLIDLGKGSYNFIEMYIYSYMKDHEGEEYPLGDPPEMLIDILHEESMKIIPGLSIDYIYKYLSKEGYYPGWLYDPEHFNAYIKDIKNREVTNILNKI